MLLNFMGYGGAFASHHNNSFIYFGNTLVIIDLSMLSIEKAKALVTEKVDRVFILLTHMHDDHFSGIPTFMHWNHFVAKREVWLVVSEELSSDIKTEMEIKGVLINKQYACLIANLSGKFYQCMSIGMNDVWSKYGWIDAMKFLMDIQLRFIPTVHAPELSGKCFGLTFICNDTRIVYSGDTCGIDPFLSYIDDRCEFYLEMSYNYGGVHLKWEAYKRKLCQLVQDKQCHVYLMHMDDEDSLIEEVRYIDGIKTVATLGK